MTRLIVEKINKAPIPAPLPDTLAFALITHYAFYAQRTTETARCHAALFGGSKFREWCYEKARYKLSSNFI